MGRSNVEAMAGELCPASNASLDVRPAAAVSHVERPQCSRRRSFAMSRAAPAPTPEVGGAAQAEPLGRFAPMVALFRCFGMAARQPLNRDRTPAAPAISSAGSPATGPGT